MRKDNLRHFSKHQLNEMAVSEMRGKEAMDALELFSSDYSTHVSSMGTTISKNMNEERESRQLELILLKMWDENGIENIFKYKNRIMNFRGENRVNIELFYDVTYKLFDFINDIATLGCDPVDCYYDVKTLLLSLKNNEEKYEDIQ